MTVTRIFFRAQYSLLSLEKALSGTPLTGLRRFVERGRDMDKFKNFQDRYRRTGR
jgi:hypothetical protein